MALPEKVTLVEVGPRDGLQNESKTIPLHTKLQLIDDLGAAGHSVIEAGSFVNPKWVPQMADSEQVFNGIARRDAVGMIERELSRDFANRADEYHTVYTDLLSFSFGTVV